MKDYESGDLIPSEYVSRRRSYSVIGSNHVSNKKDSLASAMIIRKVPFKEVVNRADEELLEYDINDMWHVWRKTGCYEVLYDGNLIWWWPRDEQVKAS